MIILLSIFLVIAFVQIASLETRHGLLLERFKMLSEDNVKLHFELIKLKAGQNVYEQKE